MGKARDLANAESRFVNATGDTVTGQLTFDGVNGGRVYQQGNDQSNSRMTLRQTTANRTWDLIAGYHNASNNGFMIYEAVGGLRALYIDDNGNFETHCVNAMRPAYSCRAWVNFNGQGTVAIRASANVSSITDLGVGEYRINFANAMPDANFATIATMNRDALSASFGVQQFSATTGNVRLVCWAGGTTADPVQVDAAIIR